MQDPEPALYQSLQRADLDAACLSDAERGLLEVVKLITLTAYKTTNEDIHRLRDLGWSDPQIAEAVYITALFAFFNRVADAFGLEDPNYFASPPPRGIQPTDGPT